MTPPAGVTPPTTTPGPRPRRPAPRGSGNAAWAGAPTRPAGGSPSPPGTNLGAQGAASVPAPPSVTRPSGGAISHRLSECVPSPLCAAVTSPAGSPGCPPPGWHHRLGTIDGDPLPGGAACLSVRCGRRRADSRLPRPRGCRPPGSTGQSDGSSPRPSWTRSKRRRTRTGVSWCRSRRRPAFASGSSPVWSPAASTWRPGPCEWSTPPSKSPGGAASPPPNPVPASGRSRPSTRPWLPVSPSTSRAVG